MVGLIRYGNAHLAPERRNLMINASTKQLKYADEQEVRAMLWLVDPHETGNRHIDIDNRFHPRLETHTVIPTYSRWRMWNWSRSCSYNVIRSPWS